MEQKLPIEVLELFKIFKENNFKLFIVGGAVRDLLLGRVVKDWDFTTDAKPEQILKLFPEGFYDNKFGTVGVAKSVILGRSEATTPESRRANLANSDSKQVGMTGVDIFEITTMRQEGDYRDHRHPVEVGWTDKIEEDLARRDFTVNAMAAQPVIPGSETMNHLVHGETTPESRSANQAKVDSGPACRQAWQAGMTVIDPFHGQQDLKEKLIKAVGSPDKRFQEDALRLMRATRIATELKFYIEEKTYKALEDNAHLIKEVAWERIRDELFKILSSENSYEGILLLREVGLLQILLPELEKNFGVYQEGPKHDREYDIGEHCLLTMKFTPSTDPLVKLAALLHDVGKHQTYSKDEQGNVTFYNHEVAGGRIVLDIAKRFNLSKKQTDKLYKLVRFHMFTINENQTDSAIRRFVKNIGVENIDDMMALRVGDRLGGGTQKAVSWRMEKFRKRIDQVLEKPFSVTDLKVNGKDVMETLGIPPSRKVGEVLDKLFQEVLEDSEKNNREYLLKRMKNLE